MAAADDLASLRRTQALSRELVARTTGLSPSRNANGNFEEYVHVAFGFMEIWTLDGEFIGGLP